MYQSKAANNEESELDDMNRFGQNKPFIPTFGVQESSEVTLKKKSRKFALYFMGFLFFTMIIIIIIATATDTDSSVNYGVLDRYYIDNKDAVCNDGTQATYYVRRQENNDTWLIYVEGGFLYCWDQATCDTRKSGDLAYLMTSSMSTQTKEVEGLLSDNCDVNPDWCDANFVFIPYCSSDYFSGTTKVGDSINPTTYSFMGWTILTSTIDELLFKHGMSHADKVLYSGKGGGAVAVLFSLDRVITQIRDGLDDPTIDVRGLADTGWISYHEPYSPRDCNSGDAADCNIAGGVQRGVTVWNPELPEACANDGYTWECFFGNVSSHYYENPVFIFTYQFDFAQLDTDGCNLHGTYDTDCLPWAEDIAMKLVTEELAPNIETGFVPGCFGHEAIDTDDWNCITVTKNGDVKNFVELMNEWYVEEHQHYMDLDFVLPAYNPSCEVCTGNP